MITVALTKGRLFKDFINYLNAQGLTQMADVISEEGRFLYKNYGHIKFIFAKGADVPVYVEEGIADVGIVGLDIITENFFDVLNVSKLPFGICRLSIAGPADLETISSVATSFTNITSAYFRQEKQEVRISHLHGSVELAPLLGLTDAIVDIVQTGTTLKENQLVEHKKIMDIQARLIANKQTFYTKEKEIYDFIHEIGVL